MRPAEPDEVPTWATVLGFALIGLGGVWSLWAIVVAFGGGDLPLTGIAVDGSIVLGLVFVFVVTPVVLGGLRLLTMLLVAGLSALAARR